MGARPKLQTRVGTKKFMWLHLLRAGEFKQESSLKFPRTTRGEFKTFIQLFFLKLPLLPLVPETLPSEPALSPRPQLAPNTI